MACTDLKYSRHTVWYYDYSPHVVKLRLRVLRNLLREAHTNAHGCAKFCAVAAGQPCTRTTRGLAVADNKGGAESGRLKVDLG